MRVEVAESPFFARSVSEFILPESGKEYVIYPDIIWDYNALRENEQPCPVTVSIQASLNKKELGNSMHTYSMRSVNECLLGYIDSKMKFHDTGDFFLSAGKLHLFTFLAMMLNRVSRNASRKPV